MDRCRLEFSQPLLATGGFREVEQNGVSVLVGDVRHATGSTAVVIELPDGFPFRPPRVRPVEEDAVPWSWHRERDGALCLVAEDDHSDLWWADPDEFLDQVKAWLEQSHAGWPGDRPDLDLERYFEPAADHRLYLYDNLVEQPDRFVCFKAAKNDVMQMVPWMGGKRLPRGRVPGRIVNLGDLDMPPRGWEGIAARLDVDVERRIRESQLFVLVAVYRRNGHPGVTVLELRPERTGGVGVGHLRSAPNTKQARSARAGVDAPALQERSVAVVGVGALGSFIADMLARAGVGTLTLADDDIVKPGNLVRHLAGPRAVGMQKVRAVGDHIGQRDSNIVVNQIGAIRTPDAALALIAGHDLVINATADFTTTALLRCAAETLDARILSSALQDDGVRYRIDVLPPLWGAEQIPASANDRQTSRDLYFEAGCGSPVSPTPPQAVIEAAAATVRHAVGIILGRPLHPAGEVRDLGPASASI